MFCPDNGSALLNGLTRLLFWAQRVILFTPRPGVPANISFKNDLSIHLFICLFFLRCFVLKNRTKISFISETVAFALFFFFLFSCQINVEPKKDVRSQFLKCLFYVFRAKFDLKFLNAVWRTILLYVRRATCVARAPNFVDSPCWVFLGPFFPTDNSEPFQLQFQVICPQSGSAFLAVCGISYCCMPRKL